MAISESPTCTPARPPPSTACAGAWACTAVKLITENTASKGDKYVPEVKMYVYEEEVDGRCGCSPASYPLQCCVCHLRCVTSSAAACYAALPPGVSIRAALHAPPWATALQLAG